MSDRETKHSRKRTKSTNDRHKPDLSLSKVRSALTNNSHHIADVDQRGSWYRRFRDLIVAYEQDLGGAETLSQGQLALVRRIALLQLFCEMQETKIAKNGFEISRLRIESYQRTTNTLRRTIEILGLHEGRKARDVSPPRPGTASAREFVDAHRSGNLD